MFDYFQDLMLDMSLTAEEESFANVARIVMDIVPKYLRKLFIELWNKKYPNHQWQSDSASGEFLFYEVPNIRKPRPFLKFMRKGNEKYWSTSTLIHAILYSDLNLIPPNPPCEHERSISLRISKELDIIRKARSFVAHAPSMQCSPIQFGRIASKMKSVARNIFDIDAEHEIDEVLESQISNTQIREQLKHQRDVEQSNNMETEKIFKGKILCSILHVSRIF